jgi:hypothetical protein
MTLNEFPLAFSVSYTSIIHPSFHVPNCNTDGYSQYFCLGDKKKLVIRSIIFFSKKNQEILVRLVILSMKLLLKYWNVLQVSDGIACIYGFNEVMAGEFDKI